MFHFINREKSSEKTFPLSFQTLSFPGCVCVINNFWPSHGASIHEKKKLYVLKFSNQQRSQILESKKNVEKKIKI